MWSKTFLSLFRAHNWFNVYKESAIWHWPMGWVNLLQLIDFQKKKFKLINVLQLISSYFEFNSISAHAPAFEFLISSFYLYFHYNFNGNWFKCEEWTKKKKTKYSCKKEIHLHWSLGHLSAWFTCIALTSIPIYWMNHPSSHFMSCSILIFFFFFHFSIRLLCVIHVRHYIFVYISFFFLPFDDYFFFSFK